METQEGRKKKKKKKIREGGWGGGGGWHEEAEAQKVELLESVPRQIVLCSTNCIIKMVFKEF